VGRVLGGYRSGVGVPQIRKTTIVHPQPPRRTTHAYGSPQNLLAYDRWGRFGRPVVLLHGLGYDRTMWWPVAAELDGTCAAVAVDLPGHGQSAPREDCRLADLAHDLATLIHGLHMQRAPIVVGHAESARLAGAFAERYATQAVITVDDGATEMRDVLDGVPEAYRQFAVARRDAGLLRAYRSWAAAPPPAPTPGLTTSSHRVRTATMTPALFGGQPMPHLRDPAGFATLLHTLR
jgi:pimeloyl-ACP methyl ester carboxylesterase